MAFWLDFLAIKSNNGSWLLSMLEQSGSMPAAADFLAYPGMAFGRALALRAQEGAEQIKVRAVLYILLSADLSRIMTRAMRRYELLFALSHR